jgi:hypothetical protein
MLQTFDNSRLASAGPDDLSDALEEGVIVFFPQSPVPLAYGDDVDFFRAALP